jgi:hypothetical protein
MTKTPLVMTALLLSGALVALSAQAADKPAAPAPAAKPAAAPAAKPAAPAPAAAKEAPKAAAPEAAAAAPPAGPPKPSPEIDQLYKGFEGNWKCESTFNAGAFGPSSPEMKVKSDVKIKKDPAGFWYRGEYKVKKSKTMPEFGASFSLGYDTATKEPVSITTDSMGGYSVEMGPGSTPENITLTGEQSGMGMKMKVKETMTKKDAKTVEHTFAVDMGKGFQQMGVDLCKK